MKTFANRILIFVVVMTAVAGVGWFGRKAYKKTSERRLVAEAREYLAKKDFHNASLSLQRALEINPVSASASDAMADLLETVGVPSALNWRVRASKLDPQDVQKHLHWAELAIKEGDLPSAAEALDGMDQKSRNTAEYHKLKGALGWSSRDAAAAEAEYSAAAALEPGNLAVQMNLATIRLESTNPAIALAAHATLEQITTNANLRLNALHQLLTDAIARNSMHQAEVYSSKIARDPSAGFPDKIEYLELLRRSQSRDYAAWLASLETGSRTSAEEAFAVGRWKVMAFGPTNALHWLVSLPHQVQTNLPVPLVMTDCQMAVKDWKSILDEVNQQDWGQANFYKFALQSLAESSLSQRTAADVSWHKSARMASHSLERLSRLAQVTEAWGWTTERSDMLTEIINEFPQENWAVDQLATQLYAEGKTSEMESLFYKVYSKDPSNPRLKNNLANLYLLRKTELDKAYVMAKEAYNSSTNNPFFASTYAYSLLLQDKKNEALNVVSGLKAEYLKIPSIALYYGIVEAQSGRKDAAREALKCAETGQLLPEERAMVQIAESRM